MSQLLAFVIPLPMYFDFDDTIQLLSGQNKDFGQYHIWSAMEPLYHRLIPFTSLVLKNSRRAEGVASK